MISKTNIEDVVVENTSLLAYHALIASHRGGNAEFKFLAEMPYEQGRQWVDKAFNDYFDLHRADPDRYPITSIEEIARTIRAYRKARNAERRASKK